MSHKDGAVFYDLINFFIKVLPVWFVMKNIRNYRKYDIFVNFRFTENMIFPSIAENPENMIFKLSVFSKMLFFMQWKTWSYVWSIYIFSFEISCTYWHASVLRRWNIFFSILSSFCGHIYVNISFHLSRLNLTRLEDVNRALA